MGSMHDQDENSCPNWAQKCSFEELNVPADRQEQDLEACSGKASEMKGLESFV